MLTARSPFSEPSRSLTRPVGRPRRPCFVTSMATRSPSSASAVAPGGLPSSPPSCFFSLPARHPFQRLAGAALDAERAGDLAFSRLAGARADEGEKVFLGGKGLLFVLLLGQAIILFKTHIIPIYGRPRSISSPCRRTFCKAS